MTTPSNPTPPPSRIDTMIDLINAADEADRYGVAHLAEAGARFDEAGRARGTVMGHVTRAQQYAPHVTVPSPYGLPIIPQNAQGAQGQAAVNPNPQQGQQPQAPAGGPAPAAPHHNQNHQEHAPDNLAHVIFAGLAGLVVAVLVGWIWLHFFVHHAKGHGHSAGSVFVTVIISALIGLAVAYLAYRRSQRNNEHHEPDQTNVYLADQAQIQEAVAAALRAQNQQAQPTQPIYQPQAPAYQPPFGQYGPTQQYGPGGQQR